MIKEGIKKFKERKLLESLSIFSKLNKSNPNNADILFFLGNIYYELNDLKKSMLYFEQSLNKLPNSLIIINNYAIVLQSLGQFEKAKKLFQKVIKLNPSNIKAYYRLFSMNLENFDKKYLNKIKSLEIKSSLDDKSLINFICSKYEKTKIIGIAAQQIQAGREPYMDYPKTLINPIDIAEYELLEKKTPFIIKRKLPNNIFEYWTIEQLNIY